MVVRKKYLTEATLAIIFKFEDLYILGTSLSLLFTIIIIIHKQT